MNTRLIQTIGVLVLAVLLSQAIVLHRYVEACSAAGTANFSMPDTLVYQDAAMAMQRGQPRAPAFRERVFLPMLLFICGRVSESPATVLWVLWIFHGLAVAAIAFLAWMLSGQLISAVLAGLLYMICPASYLFSVEIGTDLLHAQIALCAFALTIAFSLYGRTVVAVGACVFWLLTQLIRPTFFYIMPILFVFMIGWIWRRRASRMGAIAVVIAATILPLWWTLSNGMVYGVYTPSLLRLELLHRCAVPAVKVLQRHAINPSLHLTPLWEEEREIEARRDPRYDALVLNKSGDIPAGFAENYHGIEQDDLTLLASNKTWLARVGLAQLLNLALGYPYPKNEVICYDERFIRRFYILLSLASMLGGIAVWRNGKGDLLLFLLAISLLILAPASLSWWGGHRFRIAVDFVLLSLAGVALSYSITWSSLGFIVIVGYLPFKLWHLPSAYLFSVAACSLLGAAIWMRVNWARPEQIKHSRLGVP